MHDAYISGRSENNHFPPFTTKDYRSPEKISTALMAVIMYNGKHSVKDKAMH